MSSTARLLPVLAGALLLSASSAHATNFAVLFGTSAGDDDQTCNSNLDALHTNSMTFVLNGVSRLSRNTGNDSYSPWDFDDSDDGVVSNPLYEEPPSSGQNPLFEGTAELRQSIHPLSLTIVPSPIDQSWIVTVQAEFTFRPEGVADPEWELFAVSSATTAIPITASGFNASPDEFLPGLRRFNFGEEGYRDRNPRTRGDDATPYVLHSATWNLNIVVPAPGTSAALVVFAGASVIHRRRR